MCVPCNCYSSSSARRQRCCSARGQQCSSAHRWQCALTAVRQSAQAAGATVQQRSDVGMAAGRGRSAAVRTDSSIAVCASSRVAALCRVLIGTHVQHVRRPACCQLAPHLTHDLFRIFCACCPRCCGLHLCPAVVSDGMRCAHAPGPHHLRPPAGMLHILPKALPQHSCQGHLCRQGRTRAQHDTACGGW